METNAEYEAIKVEKPSLFGVITSPVIQFQRMKETAPIGGPLAIILLIMAITGALTPYITFNNPSVKNIGGSEGFHLPIGFTIGMGAIGGIIGEVIIIFVTAAIYKIFMIFMGNDTTYKKLTSIVIYTSIISSIGTLVNLLIALSVKGYELTYTSLTPLSGDNATLKVIFSNFDVFQIWHYIVLGIAFHITAGLSKNKASTLIVIIFILSIGIGIAAILISHTLGS